MSHEVNFNLFNYSYKILSSQLQHETFRESIATFFARLNVRCRTEQRDHMDTQQHDSVSRIHGLPTVWYDSQGGQTTQFRHV